MAKPEIWVHRSSGGEYEDRWDTVAVYSSREAATGALYRVQPINLRENPHSQEIDAERVERWEPNDQDRYVSVEVVLIHPNETMWDAERKKRPNSRW